MLRVYHEGGTMRMGAAGLQRYVAFLKGINVGGHNVKMDQLRALFSQVEVGGSRLESVDSFIASGNIIFSSTSPSTPTVESAVASHLESALGFAVPTFVRSLEAVRRIAAATPFPGIDAGSGAPSLYIAFLPDAPDAAAVERIEAAGTESDRFSVAGSEVYWRCSTRFSDSPFFGPAFERLLGMTTTVRNSTTVRRIAEKYGQTGG